MRLSRSQNLCVPILAAYCGVALLGQGLHFLVPHAGHHQGLSVVRCAVHGDEHWRHEDGHRCDSSRDHYGGPEPPSDKEHDGGLALTSSECAADSHLCEICAFLIQLQNQRTVIAAAAEWQPVVVTAVSALPQFYTPASVGVHAPRGPPARFA